MNTPFLVEQSSDKKYTYLDTGGRPVVVVTKSNIVFEHNIGFTVEYSFSRLNLVSAPYSILLKSRNQAHVCACMQIECLKDAVAHL